jgi:hypothetical protein
VEPTGGIIVAECKRWTDSIDQGTLASFATTLDLLRQSQAKAIAGVFFAKQAYQRGALKLADYLGLELACLRDDGIPSPLRLHRWDSAKVRRVEDLVLFVASIPSAEAFGTPTIIQGPPRQ